MNIPTLMMKYNSILKKVYMLNLKVGQLSGLVNCPGWPIVRKCKGWSIVRGWPIVRVGQLSNNTQIKTFLMVSLVFFDSEQLLIHKPTPKNASKYPKLACAKIAILHPAAFRGLKMCENNFF